MRLLLLAALLVGLCGCATTAAGKVDVKRNATNTCNFAFLAAIPGPASVVLAAAFCSFGVDMMPDEDEDDEEEEDGEKEKKAAKPKKPKVKVKGH